MAARRTSAIAPLLAASLATSCVDLPGADSERVGSWELVWADEFEAEAGTPIDATKWTHDVGGDGWGNDQLEHNTDRTDNVFHDGDGHLVIRAQVEDYEGNAYTSGRVKTQGLFDVKYGRVVASIKLPEGGGVWPAFWMLGADIETVGWPACGEIDILELRGEEPWQALGTVHGPGYSAGESVGATYTLPEGDFSDGYHVFAVEVDPEHITWTIDGVVYQTLAPGDLPDGAPWVFDDAFFLILNVAIGGHFVGPVDDSALPAEMKVEYVRVYQRAERVDDSG